MQFEKLENEQQKKSQEKEKDKDKSLHCREHLENKIEAELKNT